MKLAKEDAKLLFHQKISYGHQVRANEYKLVF